MDEQAAYGWMSRQDATQTAELRRAQRSVPRAGRDGVDGGEGGGEGCRVDAAREVGE